MNEPTATPSTAHPSRWREAYQTLLDEIEHVPDDDLIVINIDIPTAISTVLGLLPAIRALRPRIVAETPQLNLVQFDKLEAYALALGHAQALHMAASEPSAPLEQLAADAAALRETLLADATVLARRDLLHGEPLRELKGPKGYRNLAFDLCILAAMMREAWPKIVRKTALQLKELDQAELLADRLLTAVGQRRQSRASAAVSTANRHRAFSLLIAAYDQVRRAVHFLRWSQEDADTIVPSLYASRVAGRRKHRETDVAPAAREASKAARVVAASETANINGAAVASAPLGVGLPDSEPFVDA